MSDPYDDKPKNVLPLLGGLIVVVAIIWLLMG